MACYQDLKDYLKLNNLDVISQGIKDHVKSSCDVEFEIEDIKILTQSNIAFIPFDVVTFSIGVSCKASYADKKNSFGIYYFNLLLTGDMSEHFSDLRVLAVEDCTQDTLISETVTSMFGLPDITDDTLEEEADKIHSLLYAFVKKDKEHKYRFEPVKIKEKYKRSDNMHMWPADLDHDVLGQIRFEESTATIYDIADPYTPHPNSPIPANTILLNVKYFRNELGCDDIITATHELVHWVIHRDYMKLLQFLDDRYKVMECTSAPITLDDDMSPKEKARWYAEWQANELAIRVAIPKHLVEKAIDEYENSICPIHHEINSSVPHDGHYYQNMVYKLSEDFNVPKEIMKKRLRQLGYDFAEGAFVQVDGCLYPPFTFPCGAIKENETFIIDHNSYERLLRENEEFAELINSGRFIYLEYVVCILSSKYIAATVNYDDVKFELTDYARNHADECCIKFCLHSNCAYSQPTLYYDHVYLYREGYSKTSEYYYDKNNNGLSALIEDKIQDEIDGIEQSESDDEILYEMKKEGIDTFSKALTYIMDKANKPRLTKAVVAEVLGCEERTIQNYRSGAQTPDTIEKVMLICLAGKTGPKVSEFLINKAVGGIPDIGLKKTAYKFLLKYTDTSLDFWNKVLDKFGLAHIMRFDQ